MSQLKDRKVRIRVILDSQNPEDLLGFFKATEEAFAPKDLEIEFQGINDSNNGPDSLVEQPFLDKKVEKELSKLIQKKLDNLAKTGKTPKIDNSQNENSKAMKVLAKRLSVKKWLKKMAKEGYRITVKSFFEAALDKMKSM